MAVLDTLDIKISANAMNAAKALDQLANAMKRVRAALLNTKDGVTVGDQLSKSIHELNNAMNRINTSGIKKLNQLSSALHKFASAAKSLKGINIGQNVSKSIQNTQAALATQAGTATSPGGSADAYAVAEDIKDVGDETEEAGKKAKKAAGFFKKLWDSIKRIAFYRAIRSAMKAVGEAFSEGLKNAYHYSKQSETFTRLAETLDHLRSVTAQMSNQLGAFWGEFKQFIQPAVTWLIEKVRQLSEWFTELFAALNGEKTYLQAQYVAQEWDEATESAKKYKQQLLGIDELNNLTTQTKSGKEETDYSKLFKEVEVSASMLKVAEQWGKIKGLIVGALKDIELALEGFMIGVGAALLFSGTNIPLGLGLIIAGGFMAYKTAKENWGALTVDLSTTLTNIEEMLGGFMAGIGAVLLFSGAAPQWGLGLLVAGIGVFSAARKRKTDWKKMDKKLSETLTAVNLGLGAFLGVIGAYLLFSGANIPLGLGCLIAGIATISSEAKEIKNLNWNAASEIICDTLLNFFGPGGLMAFGAAELAIGALLAFSGTHIALGIALMAAGAGSLALGFVNIDWNRTGIELQNALLNAFGPGGLIGFGAGLLAIGAVLAFSGVSIPVGIAMMAAGAGSIALGASKIDWGALAKEVREKITNFFGVKGLIGFGAGLLALGAALAFSGVNIPLGLAMIAAGGGGLGLGLSEVNWGGILASLKNVWYDIENWWNSTVVAKVKHAIQWLEEKTGIDWNKDGIIGFGGGGAHTSGSGGEHGGGGSGRGGVTGGGGHSRGGDTTTTTTTTSLDIPETYEDYRKEIQKVVTTTVNDRKAHGGLVRGSLFWAGEQGPEFVGSMGSSSAVANTGQMVDAIYKAAYMGMSRALAENGGGLSGFEPATTDDLFIAMRKKASNYNKRTGSSAFA